MACYHYKIVMIGKIIFFDNRLAAKRRKNKCEDNSSASSSDRRRPRFERGRASQGTTRREGRREIAPRLCPTDN